MPCNQLAGGFIMWRYHGECVCFSADMSEGSVGDMADLGITESFQVKRQVLLSASEAAEMILRVDNIIKAAPRLLHLNPVISNFTRHT